MSLLRSRHKPALVENATIPLTYVVQTEVTRERDEEKAAGLSAIHTVRF